MVNVLPIFSCLCVIVLCAVSYNPLSTELNSATFQSWVYGPAVANLLPVWLTAFSLTYVCLMFYLVSQGLFR